MRLNRRHQFRLQQNRGHFSGCSSFYQFPLCPVGTAGRLGQCTCAMERLGVEVRKQGPHERVLAEDLGGPFPRLNRGSSGGRRTHSPNGRGTACDGRTGSSSGCSRTGRTVPAAAVPGAELRQNLGDPAHIREGGPRQSTGDLMTAVQGSQVRPMAIGLYETEKFQLLGNGIQYL